MKSKILRFAIGFCFLPAIVGICVLMGMLPIRVTLALVAVTGCALVGAMFADL